jgi:hypothetical protein
MAIVFFAAATIGANPSRAESPPYLDWVAILPSFTCGYDPSSANECTSGATRCVDAVIREMSKRFSPLADRCDHNTIFALAYLRTTEVFRQTIQDPTFFRETSWINHYDAVFAKYYFDAYDAWSTGRRAQVPRAWLIAFDAAQNREVSGTGNLVLGINAHIQRDLPFVLASVGLVRPDGSSRKDDHNRANEFLNRVNEALLPEIARRFDPSVDDAQLATFLDEIATFQIVPAWREAAWRQAERLVNATTPEARAAVEAEIEAYAATNALALKSATAYPPLLASSRPRDVFCSAHHDDP